MPGFLNFIILILWLKILKCNSIDVNLVLQLKEIFQSDVILIVKDGVNDGSDKLVKKFLKFGNVQKRAFLGVIDIQKDFEKFSENKFLLPYQNTMVISDSKTNFIEKLIYIQSLSLMKAVIWVYFTEDSIINFGDLYLPFNSRFYIIKKVEDSICNIEDVYQISENSPKIFTPFAIWENGQLKIFQNDTYGRRMDLQGHEFKIQELNFAENKEALEMLWKLFAERMNFSISWNMREVGTLLPNGTAIGLMKEILERKIDGSPSYNLYLKQRADLYDYIFPAWILETKFVVRTSSTLDWAAFLEPFHEHVYLSILIWIIISSVMIHLIIKAKCGNTSEASIFIVMRALFSQGGNLNTSSVSLCISYLMPYLLTIMLTQCYLGTLSSHLAIRHTHLPFHNLHEIINDGTYKISVFKLTAIYLYFLSDHGTEASAVRSKNLLLEEDKLPQDSQDGFDSICENRWVFLNFVTSLPIIERCEVADIEQPFMVYFTGMIVWKGFPYNSVMTKIMKRLQFAGLVNIKQRSNRIKYEKSQILEPFSMELVYPVFLLYLAVMILSLIILLWEILKKNRLKSNAAKNNISKRRRTVRKVANPVLMINSRLRNLGNIDLEHLYM